MRAARRVGKILPSPVNDEQNGDRGGIDDRVAEAETEEQHRAVRPKASEPSTPRPDTEHGQDRGLAQDQAGYPAEVAPRAMRTPISPRRPVTM